MCILCSLYNPKRYQGNFQVIFRLTQPDAVKFVSDRINKPLLLEEVFVSSIARCISNTIKCNFKYEHTHVVN